MFQTNQNTRFYFKNISNPPNYRNFSDFSSVPVPVPEQKLYNNFTCVVFLYLIGLIFLKIRVGPLQDF